ncbi:hypothetical protein OEZ86_014272 [Tetradesmus obliquus]|nr:hypothetical protein OEZ86_014272 [Tetradesmus obliquus]
MAAPGGGVQPAVFEFQFDLEFLLTTPTAFTVNLPRVTAPLLLRHRPDVNNLLSSVTASAGGDTPVPGQPSVVNSAAVNLKSARLWTGQVGIANAGLSAVSFAASTDTWNIYGEIRYLENRTNRWRFFKIVPALTPFQLADMNAADGTGSPPMQQPPVEVKCLVFEFRRLPTTSTPTRRSAAITAEAARTAAAAAAANSSSDGGGGDYAYIIQEAIPPIPKGAEFDSSAGSSSSNGSSSRRRQMLQSAANVVRQDVLMVYTGAAASNSFNGEYVRASMVNVIAITNKAYLDSKVPVVLYPVGIRQVPWQESPTPLQDATSGTGGLDVVAAWRNELSADLVSFWYSSASQPQLCGEAWVGGGDPFAYSTLNMPCWSGYFFAGAVARNQGCRSNFYAPDYGPFADGLAGPYAFGLRRCVGCTSIMITIASNPCGCNKQQEPVGFFSNPSLRVRVNNTWQPLGHPTKADCARGITETALAVSSYR